MRERGTRMGKHSNNSKVGRQLSKGNLVRLWKWLRRGQCMSLSKANVSTQRVKCVVRSVSMCLLLDMLPFPFVELERC